MKILIVQQLANENQARADAEKKAEERKVDSVSSKSAHFVGKGAMYCMCRLN